MNAKLIGSLAGLALMIGPAKAENPESKVQERSAQTEPGKITTQQTEKTQKESSSSTNKSSTYSPSSDQTTMGSSAADRGSASDRGIGGSSSSGTSNSAMRHDLAKNELTGKVVRADKNMVWIDHQGAVVPLKIESNTRFESAGVTKANELKEGQEIRASFTVKDKTNNVATTIRLEGATSGASKPGSDMEMQRGTATSPNRPSTLPEDKGTNPDTKK